MSPQQILATVTTNFVVDKSTDNAEPLSICFLPQYSTPKKVFSSGIVSGGRLVMKAGELQLNKRTRF